MKRLGAYYRTDQIASLSQEELFGYSLRTVQHPAQTEVCGPKNVHPRRIHDCAGVRRRPGSDASKQNVVKIRAEAIGHGERTSGDMRYRTWVQ
jgi:hypothetical protein